MRIVNIERILEAEEHTLTEGDRASLVRFIRGMTAANEGVSALPFETLRRLVGFIYHMVVCTAQD